MYITNVMTQPGETDGYTVSSYVKGLLNHWPEGRLDYVIANTGTISDIVSSKYETEGSEVTKLTEYDREILSHMGIQLITADLIDIKKDYVRHDAIQLSKMIIDLVLQYKVASDKSRIIDYFYLRELLKKS